jgi:hypothetical protein
MKQPYLSKPLAFPDCQSLDELFTEIQPWESSKPFGYNPFKKGCANRFAYCAVSLPRNFNSKRVRVSEKVTEFIRQNMLKVDHDTISFEVVYRDDNTVLVLVRYNVILGERWLALIPVKKVRLVA